jgi:3-oxoacyl-[acyl-carrier-protein] synthase-3
VFRYKNVCLEAFGYALPDEIVASAEIERRLTPLYERLRLPMGRLEMITGIRERRFWPVDTLPSEKSIESGRRAIESAGIDRRLIGALVHGSVCRDHLEPATACRVHHHLGLPRDCLVYDVSNACLGLVNGMVQIANMIELGQIRAGLVVGSEGGRQLVETTIETLNSDASLKREDVKQAVASLTIGSASCAVVLAHRDVSRARHRLLGGVARANTEFHHLCQSGADEAVAGGMRPLMDTDSERLMHEGIGAGAESFDRFLSALGWRSGDIDQSFCHQVGTAHRKLMLGRLGLDDKRDYSTVEWLGNTGSVALPVTMALGVEQGRVKAGYRVAMLGIGSGINVVILGVEW